MKAQANVVLNDVVTAAGKTSIKHLELLKMLVAVICTPCRLIFDDEVWLLAISNVEQQSTI